MNNNYNNYNEFYNYNNNYNELLHVFFNDILNANDTYFPAATQTVMQNSLYERNPVRHVITEEVKNGLLPIKFRDATDAENNSHCSITFEPFQEEDDIIQLPCNHCFFVDPVMKWLTEESCECPVCRYKFDSVEKNIVEPEQNEDEGQYEYNNRNLIIRYDDNYDYNYINNYYPRFNNNNLINLINQLNEIINDDEDD